MVSDRIPHATRMLPRWHKVAAELLAGDVYLNETRRQFVGRGMTLAHGMANPSTLSELYDAAMLDAGLAPLD